MPMLISLITNGLTCMPNSSMVMLGPKGMTAKSRSWPAPKRARMGARVKRNLFAPAGMMSSLKKSFNPSAIGLQDAIGADFHRAIRSTSIEDFALREGEDHDGQHHHSHYRGDLRLTTPPVVIPISITAILPRPVLRDLRQRHVRELKIGI